MSNLNNLKLVLIGDSDSKQIISEIFTFKNNQLKKESHLLFDKICNKGKYTFNNRNKIHLSQGYAFFIIYPINRLYFIVTDINYPEKMVWDLIDTIDKDNIFLLINEKGELNSSGKQALMTLIDQYEDFDSENNYKENDDNLQNINIEKKTENKKDNNNFMKNKRLDDNAYVNMLKDDFYKNVSKRNQLISCLQYFKWKIILIFLGIIFVLVFVIPYFWK